jgi:hypothetical protein
MVCTEEHALSRLRVLGWYESGDDIGVYVTHAPREARGKP